MEAGLTYLKYSFESTDDLKFKDIRGNAANFTQAYEKTKEIIKIKNDKGLNTKIIITMIDVGHDEEQQEEFKNLSKVLEQNKTTTNDGLSVYSFSKTIKLLMVFLP